MNPIHVGMQSGDWGGRLSMPPLRDPPGPRSCCGRGRTGERRSAREREKKRERDMDIQEVLLCS